MSIHSNMGGIGKTSEVMYFEWKIGNFITMVESESFGICESPAFPFANIPWRLELWRKSNIKPDCMTLRLCTRCVRTYPVEYNLGMKRLDNSVDQLGTGILSAGEMAYTDGYFIKLSEILQQKCVLIPFDQITFVCTIQIGTISSIKPKPKILNPNLQLSKIKDFLRDREFCDVSLNVKNKVFKAHKVILAARSPVFQSYFKNDALEKHSGIINISDCYPESFKVFLEYLYCGKLENIPFHRFFELYKIADKFDVKELQMLCIKSIEDNLNVQNFCDIVAFAEERKDTNLFVIAQDFFNVNLKEILKSVKWGSLSKSNFKLANKLLTEMASCIEGVVKPCRLEKIDPLSE